MPGEASTQRPPVPPQALSVNAVHEFATSNSTSSHFLGTPQRSWMTGGIVTGGVTRGANAASRAPRTNVDHSPVNKHVPDTHSRSTMRVEKDGEGDTTRGNVLGDHFTFTAPLRSSTTNGPSNPQNDHTASTSALETTTNVNHSQGLARNAGTNSIGPWTSTRGQGLTSETLTQSISAPAPPVTTQASQPSFSTAPRQTTGADLPSLHTTPQADWYTWQSAEALRFSAGQAGSPTMVTAPNQAQPPGPAVARTPTLVCPVLTQATETESRKRPAEPIDDSRRTRSRSDDPAVSQIPTPLATPTTPSQPYLVGLLMDSVNRLRQQQPLNMIDEQRISLLREACQSNDMVYVMLHQIYCIAFVNRGFLASLTFNHAELQGLTMLEPILVHNNRLTPGALSLATNFPRQPYSLSEPASAQTLTSVRSFLCAIGARWDVLRDTCKARGYPPSTIEIAFAFSLYSATMQKTLFNSMHRQVSGPDNSEFGHRALELFLQDQLQFYQQPAPLSHDVVVQDGRRFGQKYLQLRGFHSGTQHPVPQQRRVSAHCPVNTYFVPNPVQARVLRTGPLVPSQGFQPSQAQPAVAGNSVNTRPGHPHHTSPYMATSPEANQGPHTVDHGGPMTQPIRAANAAAASSFRPHVVNAPHPNTVSASRKASANYRLLPPPGYPVPFTTNPNPDRVALHQAHLRSPIPRKLDLSGNDMPDLRLYQYVEDFVLEPQKMDANTKFKEWHFNIDQPDFLQKAQDLPVNEFFPDCRGRLYRLGSYLFRLKAITRAVGLSEPVASSEFNVSPTTWPQCCFVSVNDCHDVEFRRRQHHARDLPADLSPLVRPGHNHIQLSNHSITEELKKVFFFAVERIHVVDHATITGMPLKLRATASLVSITSALKASQDDEVSFADPFISIDLVDPFMATIWRTPVRSITCKHRECFDLQAFLLSRTSKVKDGPTNPDQWMCPICKKDARPQNLMIDGFLVQVRAELEAKEQLDARAILVKQDGSWEAKFDKDKKDPPSGKQTTAPGPVANGPQQSGLGLDLDGMPGGEANGIGTDAKETLEKTASGPATPTVDGAAQMQTPIAVATVIEIDDDD